MDAFTHVIRPGTVPYINTKKMSVFCKIDWNGKRLSITGVEGPTSDGNAMGGCGQIDMHLGAPGGLEGFEPAENWTLETMQTLLDHWSEWHLNDMRAFDAEMKAAGWRERAKRPITLYRYSLTAESYAAKRAAETAATGALRAGATFTPTPAQIAAASMAHGVELYSYPEDGPPETPDGYELSKDHFRAATENKTLGWVRPDEHPDGLLGRAVREGGNRYGVSWYDERVPDDVLQWLAALPPADRQPAWV